MRITPAWAGKRWAWDALSTSCWDYPRVGGEKLRMGFLRGLVLGSPPHGRGKDFMFCGQHLEIRITPAWAGKSAGFSSGVGKLRDHPRVGGEKAATPPQ